jgi:hypothetical protein
MPLDTKRGVPVQGIKPRLRRGLPFVARDLHALERWRMENCAGVAA